MDPSLDQLLKNLLCGQNDLRKQAEDSYNAAKETPDALIPNLCMFVVNAGEDVTGTGQMASVLLRKCVSDENVVEKMSEPIIEKLKTTLVNSITAVPSKLIRRQLEMGIAGLGCQLVTKGKWPGLNEFLSSQAEGGTVEQRQSALNIWGEMAASLEEVSGQIGPVLNRCLQVADLKVKVAAAKCAFDFITVMDNPAGYGVLLPHILNTTVASLQEDPESAEEILTKFSELMETNPDFIYKDHVAVLTTMLNIAKTHDFDDKLRHLAVEIILSFTESSAKLMKKAGPILDQFIDVLIHYMNTEEDADSTWHTTCEDNDDDYTDADVGAEALDRIAIAIGGTAMERIISNKVQALLSEQNRRDWRNRHAAVKILAQVAEGCQTKFEKNLATLSQIVFNHVADEHPKVRYTAGRAISQFCTDFAPGFQSVFHEQILNSLAKLLQDTSPRVKHVGASAIINFCEDAEPEQYKSQLPGMLSVLYNMLMSKDEATFIKEVCLSGVSALAENVAGRFTEFYDNFVTVLKTIFNLPEDHKEFRTLKGKAIECMSFIGGACPDKFMANGASSDCIATMNYMLGVTKNLQDDDTRSETLHASWGRLASFTGDAFLPFASELIPIAASKCISDDDATILDPDEEPGDGIITIKLAIRGQGNKKLGISCSVLEEKTNAAQTLEVYFGSNLNAKLFSHTQAACQAALASIANPYNSDLRISGANLLPLIMKCTKSAVVAGTIQQKDMGDLLTLFINALVEQMQREDEVNVASILMENFHETVTECGADCISQQDLARILDVIKAIFVESLKRRAEFDQEASKGPEDDEDEDDMRKLTENLSNEEDFLIQSSEVIGVLVKTHQGFIAPFEKNFLPDVVKLLDISKFGPIGVKLALCIFDDFLEHGKEKAMGYFHDIVKAIWNNALVSADAAQAGAYGMSIAATYGTQIVTVPGNPGLPEAFVPKSLEFLKTVCKKSNDDEWDGAVCNAAKALLIFMDLYPGQAGLNEAEVIPFICRLLPVGGDLIEAKVVHERMFNLVKQGSPYCLGPNQENLPQIKNLAQQLLAEYEDEDERRINEDTRKLILEMFQ